MQFTPINSRELEQQYAEFLACSSQNNLWQSAVWGKFQESLGRKTARYAVTDEAGKFLATAQVTEMGLKFGKKYWYINRGPLFLEEKAADFLLLKLKKIAPKEVVFISYDSFVEWKSAVAAEKTHTSQPEDTLYLDLTQGEEEILAQMKQKGRYNLRLAEKKGVVIKETKAVGNFYKLLQETTSRDGFAGWGQDFYEKMVQNLGENCVVLEAEFENRIIAAGIFTYFGDQAVYYYGASSNADRNVMAPYLLQFAAIKEGKKRGCKIYDFLGIAPENASAKHAWAGVTDFKLKFGGTRIAHPKAKKIVLHKSWNLLYSLYKKFF